MVKILGKIRPKWTNRVVLLDAFKEKSCFQSFKEQKWDENIECFLNETSVFQHGDNHRTRQICSSDFLSVGTFCGIGVASLADSSSLFRIHQGFFDKRIGSLWGFCYNPPKKCCFICMCITLVLSSLRLWLLDWLSNF